MSTFKSFEPKKFTKSIRYNQELRYKYHLNNKQIKFNSELCENCGYPQGEHFFIILSYCPSKVQILDNSIYNIKYLKPVKHNETTN